MNEMGKFHPDAEEDSTDRKLHREKEIHEIRKLLSEAGLGAVVIASFLEPLDPEESTDMEASSESPTTVCIGGVCEQVQHSGDSSAGYYEVHEEADGTETIIAHVNGQTYESSMGAHEGNNASMHEERSKNPHSREKSDKEFVPVGEVKIELGTNPPHKHKDKPEGAKPKYPEKIFEHDQVRGRKEDEPNKGRKNTGNKTRKY